MIPEVSLFTRCFAFTAALPVAVLVWKFSQAARTADRPLRLIWAAGGLFVLYVALTGVAAAQGVFLRFGSFPPIPGLPVVLLPVLVFGVIAFLPSFRPVLEGVSPAFLIGFQTFRFLPETLIFLLYREGAMPAEMTLEGRNYDLLVAASAPFAAFVVHRFGTAGRAAGVVWNAAGILILINTIVTALLSMPTPVQRFAFDRPNVMPLTFPFYLLPAVFVVLALCVHIFSLRRFSIGGERAASGAHSQLDRQTSGGILTTR